MVKWLQHCGLSMTLWMFSLDIKLVIVVYFSTYFSPFYPTSNPLSFLLQAHNSWIMKTRHKKSSYWYKDKDTRLHCTQDRNPTDSLQPQQTRLFNNPRTLKGHVELLNSPIHNHLINPPMLLYHILDLLRGISCDSNVTKDSSPPTEDRPGYRNPVEDCHRGLFQHIFFTIFIQL